MDIDQRKEIVEIIAGAYPRFFEPKTDVDSPQKRMELWNERLKDWDYQKTLDNLNHHIDTSIFEPKIAEIKPKNKYKPDTSWMKDMDEMLGRKE